MLAIDTNLIVRYLVGDDAGQAARARRLIVPGRSTRVLSSHHCQLWRWRSPNKRAPCQGPPPMLTSTRAIGAAPDQATPRTISSPASLS